MSVPEGQVEKTQFDCEFKFLLWGSLGARPNSMKRKSQSTCLNCALEIEEVQAINKVKLSFLAKAFKERVVSLEESEFMVCYVKELYSPGQNVTSKEWIIFEKHSII